MQFQFPTSPGLRKITGEVGIIVIGVLVALGAQQVVESLHDRRVGEETRAAVRDEIEGNLVSLKLRSTATPCVDRRLAEIRQRLDEWGQTGRFKRPLWVAQAPRLTLGFARYDAALSAGRLALLPREEQYRLGSIAGDLRDYQGRQDAEFLTWARLRTLEAGPDVLGASDRTMIRTALQEASYHNYGIKLQVAQLLPRAAEYGFQPNAERLRQVVRRIWKNGRYSPAICVGIDTLPADANRLSHQVTPLPL